MNKEIKFNYLLLGKNFLFRSINNKCLMSIKFKNILYGKMYVAI